MNAFLNVASKAVTLTTPRPPLVVALKGGSYAWIHQGHGFLLHRMTRVWAPLVDAEGIGGTVLDASEVAALVAEFGRPT
ncbi:MAG: hypothetical protein Q8K32_09200 [Archangium sp.]|nr:hypothetical protein [Archangium sp.]